MQIRVDEITAERMPFEYYFKIEKEGNETPPNLNLFEAVKWNQFYIHLDPKDDDSSLIDNQLNKRKLVSVNQSKEMFAMINPQKGSWGYVHPYLFEGSTSGKGKIVLIVKGKDQNGNIVEICRKEAKIHLEPIDYFYDKYVLDIQDYDDDIPDSQAYLGSAAGYSGDPNSNDYILFVHGWNWNMWEKKRYTETMFKRLWWQGYKGKMGVFIWPNESLSLWEDLFKWASQFDRSEIRAFRSAQALVPVLNDLKNNKHYSLHIFAHSQGNVVVGEALRQNALVNANGILVDTYIAAQAALPGHCYDQGADPMTVDLNSNTLFDNFKTPNVYAYDYSLDDHSKPYFEKSKSKAGKMFNYFNRYDYALGWWQADQRTKPDWRLFNSYGYYDHDDSWDTYNPELGDYFYEGTRKMTFENDRYIIFARCSQSRSLALGQLKQKNPPEGFIEGFNLQIEPLSYDDKRYSHSREFRSDIIMEWPFWEKVKTDISLGN